MSPPKSFLTNCTSECLIDPWLGDVEARVLEEDSITTSPKDAGEQMNEVTQILHSIEQGDSNAAQNCCLWFTMSCASSAAKCPRGAGADFAGDRAGS